FHFRSAIFQPPYRVRERGSEGEASEGAKRPSAASTERPSQVLACWLKVEGQDLAWYRTSSGSVQSLDPWLKVKGKALAVGQGSVQSKLWPKPWLRSLVEGEGESPGCRPRFSTEQALA